MNEEQSEKIKLLTRSIADSLFQVDELKVTVIRQGHICADMSSRLSLITEKNESLKHNEETIREENTMLQKKLKELLLANKEVTQNYISMKRLHDTKKTEYEDLIKELETARDGAQIALVRAGPTLRHWLHTNPDQRNNANNTKQKSQSLTRSKVTSQIKSRHSRTFSREKKRIFPTS